MCSKLKRLPADRRGTTVLEFALVFPMYLMLLLGAFELGSYFTVYHSVDVAADAAARAVISNPKLVASNGVQDCNSVKNSVTGKVPLLTASKLNVCVTLTTDKQGIRKVSATASYPHSFASPYFNGLNSPDEVNGSIKHADKISTTEVQYF